MAVLLLSSSRVLVLIFFGACSSLAPRGEVASIVLSTDEESDIDLARGPGDGERERMSGDGERERESGESDRCDPNESERPRGPGEDGRDKGSGDGERECDGDLERSSEL